MHQQTRTHTIKTIITDSSTDSLDYCCFVWIKTRRRRRKKIVIFCHENRFDLHPALKSGSGCRVYARRRITTILRERFALQLMNKKNLFWRKVNCCQSFRKMLQLLWNSFFLLWILLLLLAFFCFSVSPLSFFVVHTLYSQLSLAHSLTVNVCRENVI